MQCDCHNYARIHTQRSWRSCRGRTSRRRTQRAALGPKPQRGGCRPPSSGRGSRLASIYRPASNNRAYLRNTRDSFMVFREAKSLARTLAPLVKKSDALAWMKPIWARQALDAFLFECYKVPCYPPGPLPHIQHRPR